MPRLAVPKPETKYRNAEATDKPYTITDGGGLMMTVMPSGAKLWSFRYRFGIRRRELAIKGGYPLVSVKKAREIAETFRKQLTEGIDPAEVIQIAQAAAAIDVKEEQAATARLQATFQVVAEEWMNSHLAIRSESTRTSTKQRLERNIYPWIGDRPISELTAPELLEVIRRIERTGKHEMAHRVLRRCGQIIRYAVQTGRAPRDFTPDLRGALAPAEKGHRAAITDPKQFAVLLRDIDNYQGWLPVHYALRLLPLVFTRPGELRLAEWTEIDFDRAIWNIPAGRMKMRIPHSVPLSRQAILLLQELRRYTGDSRYLFPTPRQKDKTISNVAILNGLRRMGYMSEEMSAHGFRATARTLLDEHLGMNPYHIEAQLAHRVPDSLGTAYNRTQHLDARRKMMQDWADYLDKIRAGDVG